MLVYCAYYYCLVVISSIDVKNMTNTLLFTPRNVKYLSVFSAKTTKNIVTSSLTVSHLNFAVLAFQCDNDIDIIVNFLSIFMSNRWWYLTNYQINKNCLPISNQLIGNFVVGFYKIKKGQVLVKYDTSITNRYGPTVIHIYDW